MTTFHRTAVSFWALGLCSMLFASAVIANDCRLERVASVDLLVSKKGQLEIPAEINGTHVKLGIDAGGTLSGIFSGAIGTLHLRSKEIAQGRLTYGGIPLTQAVRIDVLKIGNASWSPFEALVYPGSKLISASMQEDEVVGALGQGAFSKLDVELDFGAHQLRLYTQNHCAGGAVYWSTSYDVLPLQRNLLGNLFITMAVNGKLVAASISTMNSISSIEEEAAQKILGLDGTTLGGTGGEEGCSNCRSITLQAQGLEVRNARVKVVRSTPDGCQLTVPKSASGIVSYDCLGAFPLHLGLSVLSNLHLYYANGEKKLYFTDAGAKASDTAAGTGSAGSP